MGFLEFVLEQLLIVDVGAGSEPLATLLNNLDADTLDKEPSILAILPQESHLCLVRDFPWALAECCPGGGRWLVLGVLISKRWGGVVILRDVGR
jgi:archaellum biogenesis protein FlaJ (TadC family)